MFTRFLFIYMKTMTENLKISQIAMKNPQRKEHQYKRQEKERIEFP